MHISFFISSLRLHINSNKTILRCLISKSLSATKSRLPFIMKLDTPEFKAIITEEVKVLQTLLEGNGHEIRIAGGAVRDLLLGIQPKDLDFATTATPEEMKDIFTKNKVRMINMKGEKHGTITPRINDKENFEVTTLRIDVVTDGRRAEVEFTKDWMLDANRRDLTINSMFLGLDGTLYDYFNGFEDIKKRRVVFVGDANSRIQEDYLRILRYFRFYGRICESNEKHDVDTLESIRANARGLERVSGERIWVELHKTIEGPFGPELLSMMIDLGIGPFIGLPQCNMKQYNEICNRMKAGKVKLNSITLICGLLDKPDDFMVFHQRVKLSAFHRDLGFFVMEHRGEKPDDKPLRQYQMLVLLSHNKKLTFEYVKEVLLYRGELQNLEKFKEWNAPKFPISGNMIRATVETASGAQIGFLLRKLQEMWVHEDCKPTEEELLQRLPGILSSHECKRPRLSK